MMEPMFKEAQIVEYIRSKEWEGFENFSSSDIRKCDNNIINRVYLNYMHEFGYSQNMLVQEGAHFEVLKGIEYPEMHRDGLPQMYMLSILRRTFQKLNSGMAFALRDIMKPELKRTLYFFSLLQNFSLFIDSYCQKDFEINQHVEKLVQNQKDLLRKIDTLKKEREALTNNNAMRKAEEEHIDCQIQQTEIKMQRTLDEVNNKKSETDKILSEIKLLELEAERKQSAVTKVLKTIDGVDGLHKINQQLEHKLNEFHEREKNLSILRKVREDMENMLHIYKKCKQLAVAIQNEFDKMDKGNKMKQDLQSEMNQLSIHESEQNRIARELEARILDIQINFNKLELQHAQRIAAKQIELTEMMEQEKILAGNMSQELLDLITLTRDRKSMHALKEQEMQEMEQKLKHNYARILQSLEMFNKKVAEKFEAMK